MKFGNQGCPNEIEHEWYYKDSSGATKGADEGLVVKCIKEAGTPI